MGWTSSGIEKATDKREVLSCWDDTYDSLPNRTSDSNSLRFLGSFSSEAEAKKAINNYDISGMAYAEVNTGKESAKLRDAKELLSKESSKLKSFKISSSVYNSHNGKTIGCTDCGSSFPRDYFYKNDSYNYSEFDEFVDGKYLNTCPICGHDLRSKTTFERIEGYRKNIQKYTDRVNSLMETEKAKPYYLYKIHAYLG